MLTPKGYDIQRFLMKCLLRLKMRIQKAVSTANDMGMDMKFSPLIKPRMMSTPYVKGKA